MIPPLPNTQYPQVAEAQKETLRDLHVTEFSMLAWDQKQAQRWSLETFFLGLLIVFSAESKRNITTRIQTNEKMYAGWSTGLGKQNKPTAANSHFSKRKE